MNRVDHLPIRSASNPDESIVKIANPRKTDMIMPSSNFDAPTSTMYKGRIG